MYPLRVSGRYLVGTTFGLPQLASFTLLVFLVRTLENWNYNFDICNNNSIHNQGHPFFTS